MDFLRSNFFKNESLISCPFLSSKLDSPVIKTFFTLSECLSNVLITGSTVDSGGAPPEFGGSEKGLSLISAYRSLAKVS